MMNRKAQVMILISFLIMATVIIVIGAIVAPLGTRISSEFYVAGEQILADSQPVLSQIQDAEVSQALNDTIAAARASQQDNITVTSNMYQYSWVFVIVLTALVMFIFTRRLVEYGVGGFV